MRQLSSSARPSVYPCTVFCQPRPLPEGAHSYHWPAADCIVYCRMGGITGDNSIVYDSYFLAVRWTGHAKINS